MPIVDPPKPDAPLSQGDILFNIRFFATESCWQTNGGDSAKAPYNLCMVISRPCVAAYKDSFLVAAVEKLKDTLPKSDSFEKCKSLLSNLRDGRTSPDMFYLGQLPDRPGRHAARLDSIHTLATPKKSDDMQLLLRSRIGTLNIEFCRDLHVRIFMAFASLGFDDHQWFSREDLTVLVDQGKVDLAAKEHVLAEKKLAKSSYEAEGKKIPEGQIEAAQKAVDDFRAELAPYQAELDKRPKS